MNDKRTPREIEGRKTEERPTDQWIPQSTLPVPNERPGIVHRWVRTSSLGNSDNTNVSQKFREGWTPVKSEDYPELQVMSDIDSRFKGNVEIGGLLLCAVSKELMDQRDAYHKQVAQNQIESVDRHFLRENDPRMPLLDPERKSRTSFGRG